MDFEKLKEQLDKINSNMNKKQSQRLLFWKPKNGVNHIKLMPAWTDKGPHAGNISRTVWQHWGVSEINPSPVLAPGLTPHLEGVSVIEQVAQRLLKQKDDPEAVEVGKKIKAKCAHLFNVVDLNDREYTKNDVSNWHTQNGDADRECPFKVGDLKIQVYAAPPTVARSIFEFIVENQIDITHPATGGSVKITRTPKAGKGTSQAVDYSTLCLVKATPIEIPEGLTLPQLHEIGRVLDRSGQINLLSEGPASDYASKILNLPASQQSKALPAHAEGDVDGDEEEEAKPVRRSVKPSKPVLDDFDDEDSLDDLFSEDDEVSQRAKERLKKASR